MKGDLIMKTKEELNALREEVMELDKKLVELSENELQQVIGGLDDTSIFTIDDSGEKKQYEPHFYHLK